MDDAEEKAREFDRVNAKLAEKQAEADTLISQIDAKTEVEILERRKSELIAIESRLNKKMFEFRKFVDDTQLAGRAEAGIITPPVNEEQEAKDKINKWLETTGMKI